jgi:FkbM family methyltransferase
MVKKALKYILYRIIGKPFYLVLKTFWHPSENMRRRLRFIGEFRVTTSDGKKFWLFNNAFHLENHIFWLGIDNYPWEQTTRQIWIKLCNSSETILDIGANSGIYSVLARVYNPDSNVIAFEPQPNVFKVLRKNNEINGFDIRCEQLALSNAAGKLPFYNYGPDTFSTENTTAGSLNKNWVTREQSSIIVEVVKLESYIDERNLARIDLMKIDVETLEYEVLTGYGSYLQSHQPVIILEIQNREIGNKIESLFESGRYTFYNIDEQLGLQETQVLGLESENLNYLLCPKAKTEQIKEFIKL